MYEVHDVHHCMMWYYMIRKVCFSEQSLIAHRCAGVVLFHCHDQGFIEKKEKRFLSSLPVLMKWFAQACTYTLSDITLYFYTISPKPNVKNVSWSDRGTNGLSIKYNFNNHFLFALSNAAPNSTSLLFFIKCRNNKYIHLIIKKNKNLLSSDRFHLCLVS